MKPWLPVAGLCEGDERGGGVSRAPQHESELEPERGVARQKAKRGSESHHRLRELPSLQEAVHDHSVGLSEAKLGVPENEGERGSMLPEQRYCKQERKKYRAANKKGKKYSNMNTHTRKSKESIES